MDTNKHEWVLADAVIVGATLSERITDHEDGQIMNYLKITGLRLGLILNFKHRSFEWKRVVL